MKHCVEEESSKSDVVTAADCGPEIQKHFLLLLEKSLKPRGFWSVLFKYSDGSAEELKAPNLPAGHFYFGLHSHANVIGRCSAAAQATRSKVSLLHHLRQARLQIYPSRLQSEPAARRICLGRVRSWVRTLSSASAVAFVTTSCSGIGQLKWDNRNLFNAKITLFAVEYWRWNYLQFMQKPPPQSPLCSSGIHSFSFFFHFLEY